MAENSKDLLLATLPIVSAHCNNFRSLASKLAGCHKISINIARIGKKGRSMSDSSASGYVIDGEGTRSTETAVSSQEQQETDDTLKELLQAKMRLAMLQRKKRILLEEIHRQCLEGEVDPKKRLKPFFDKCKKAKINVTAPPWV
ncbi:MAG: hypothetical protein EOO89_24405 [Pedobacter sp.]|nr:MAG: hypothetical protein EOO89_24405 [Pedobacter sp.]